MLEQLSCPACGRWLAEHEGALRLRVRCKTCRRSVGLVRGGDGAVIVLLLED